MEIIEKYPNKPWNWFISKHPNITMEILLKSIRINLGIGILYLIIQILR